MGSKEIGALLIFFSYIYILATSSPLHKALPSSDSLQETHFAHRHDSSYVGDSGRSSIKHSSKFEHAFGSGTANGGGGSAGTGQNGGTRSPLDSISSLFLLDVVTPTLLNFNCRLPLLLPEPSSSILSDSHKTSTMSLK